MRSLTHIVAYMIFVRDNTSKTVSLSLRTSHATKGPSCRQKGPIMPPKAPQVFNWAHHAIKGPSYAVNGAPSRYWKI